MFNELTADKDIEEFKLNRKFNAKLDKDLAKYKAKTKIMGNCLTWNKGI